VVQLRGSQPHLRCVLVAACGHQAVDLTFALPHTNTAHLLTFLARHRQNPLASSMAELAWGSQPVARLQILKKSARYSIDGVKGLQN